MGDKMEFKSIYKKIIFLLLFAVLTFIGYQINFSAIVGSESQAFTFYQFFGPLAGAFMGPLVGAVSVLAAQVGNYLLLGKAFDVIGLLRLAPMIFAAVYFASKKERITQASALVPLACMALFWLHPVGAQAWIYPLYWVIPILAKVFSDRLFLKSLGATFTAHAVGSTLWLYTVPMPAEAWMALIPIVAVERLIFAGGITVSFLLVNTVLAKVANYLPAEAVKVDARYVISKKLFRLSA